MTLSEKRWTAIKLALPAGSTVSGSVVAHRPFGFFVSLPSFPDLTALVEVTIFAEELGHAVGVSDFPPLGSSVKAVVLYYADGAQQARLGRVELE